MVFFSDEQIGIVVARQELKNGIRAYSIKGLSLFLSYLLGAFSLNIFGFCCMMLL